MSFLKRQQLQHCKYPKAVGSYDFIFSFRVLDPFLKTLAPANKFMKATFKYAKSCPNLRFGKKKMEQIKSMTEKYFQKP